MISTSGSERQCSVLVSSCDAYSDLWTPFFTLLWQNWPDCPFPVYLSSNHETFPHPRVMTIRTGPDRNWANQMRKAIDSIDSPYLLLILEDFFLQHPVNSEQCLSCLRDLLSLDGHMLRLVPDPRPNVAVKGHPAIGCVKQGEPYRVSMQASLWRRQTLIDLIRDGESIWQFEMNGSRRSDELGDGFYCVWQPLLFYGQHVVEQGKWFRHEARHFEAMKIGCDFSRRSIMSRRETLTWGIRTAFWHLLKFVPRAHRQKLEQLARKQRPLN